MRLASLVVCAASLPAVAQPCAPDQQQLINTDFVGSSYTDPGTFGEWGVAQTFTPSITGVICDITVWLQDNNSVGNVSPRIHFFGVDSFGVPDPSNYLGGNLVGSPAPTTPSAYTFNVLSLSIPTVANQMIAFQVTTSGTNASSGYLEFWGDMNLNAYTGGEMFISYNPSGPGGNPALEQFSQIAVAPTDLYFVETVMRVPAPGALALIGAAGLLATRRRRA